MDGLSARFSADFQTRCLAVAATQPFFLDLYLDVFKPSLFTSNYHREVSTWITEFYVKYKTIPSLSSMRKIFSEHITKDNPLRVGYQTLIEQIYATEVTDFEYVKDQIITAAKFQSLRTALTRMVDQLDEGDFESLPKLLNDAMRVGSGSGDLGAELLSSMESAVLRFGVLEQPVTTGFTQLERAVGGLYSGEETVIVSPPNQGKTSVLGNVAYGAARHDNTVFYYTLEIGMARMLCRLYARMAQIGTKDLAANLTKLRGVAKRFRLSTSGTIYVKFFPARTITVETLKSHLAMAKGLDVNPSMVVVDYADLIRPVDRNTPRHEALREIYEDLRALANEFNVHVLTGSQSKQNTLYAYKIDLDDLSESWGKAATADSVVCICQTEEEQKSQVGRLYVAKARNETRGTTVHLRTDFKVLTVTETDRKTYVSTLRKAGYSPQVERKRKQGRLDPEMEKELEK